MEEDITQSVDYVVILSKTHTMTNKERLSIGIIFKGKTYKGTIEEV